MVLWRWLIRSNRFLRPFWLIVVIALSVVMLVILLIARIVSKALVIVIPRVVRISWNTLYTLSPSISLVVPIRRILFFVLILLFLLMSREWPWMVMVAIIGVLKTGIP
jgi:hypothetical protein